MHSATDWVSKHLENTQSAAIFTDSQSLCTALVGNSSALKTPSAPNSTTSPAN